MLIAYFSGKTGNTRRLVSALDVPCKRIPIVGDCFIDEPYVLALPTYARADGSNAVVPQVKTFFKRKEHVELLRGVISTGNTNFGEWFGVAADVISQRFGVPIIHKAELSGTDKDVRIIKERMKSYGLL